MSNSILAERIKAGRKAKGMTQDQAARAAEMPAAQWAFYEQGVRTPSTDNLRRICTAIHISADWLLGISSENVRVHTPLPATASDETGVEP